MVVTNCIGSWYHTITTMTIQNQNKLYNTCKFVTVITISEKKYLAKSLKLAHFKLLLQHICTNMNIIIIKTCSNLCYLISGIYWYTLFKEEFWWHYTRLLKSYLISGIYWYTLFKEEFYYLYMTTRSCPVKGHSVCLKVLIKHVYFQFSYKR